MTSLLERKFTTRSDLKLFVIVAISAIFGAAVGLHINNSEAQPEGGKEFRFVLTGTLVTDMEHDSFAMRILNTILLVIPVERFLVAQKNSAGKGVQYASAESVEQIRSAKSETISNDQN